MRILGNREDAEEAIQDAFLRAFRGLGSYQDRERFSAWLTRILINQCRMADRSSRIRDRATDSLAREQGRRVAQPDEELLRQERRKAVEAALQDLSDKLREVAVLRYGSGHSLEEIAEILELPLGTVKSRLSSAVAGLRASLEVRHG